MSIHRHIVAATACYLAACAITQTGCRPRPAAEPSAPVSFSGPTMGTWYHVKVAELPADVSQRDLQQAVEERLHRVNQLMSTYLPESELSRFNRYAGDDWFDVSPETATVVVAAQEVAEATEGAFDVTVGPLVNLWNFGPDPNPDRFPDDQQIAQAMERVDYRRVQVRLDPPALRKAQPDVYIDLSAIAKGFAVDTVAELLHERGVHRFMVEIGGEVQTAGRKADGAPWRIGIERPVTSGRMIQQVVELVDDALATSGDYRNYFDWNGRRYSHEIDPRSGRPVDHTLASVSVITDSCMNADALATALIVLGPEQALQYAEQHDLDVLLIVRDGDQFRERRTPGFAARIQAQQPGGET
jgi:thiamine biosynthesis lipoprotein